MKFITLTNTDRLAIIDAEDYEQISKYKWWLSPQGYAVRKSKGKTYMMHRILTQAKGDEYVDHANRQKLDNRKTNLRLCDQSYNMANMKIPFNNTSGYKGVAYNKNEKKYKAYICRKGMRYYLGTYIDAEDAAKAYNLKAEELFGEYARLNNV